MTDLIIDALKTIARQVQDNSVPVEDQMWTAEQIGNYMKLSAFTVSQKVVTRPGFPAPCLPTGSTKRWFAGEVIQWAKLNRGKLPIGRAS